MKLLKYPLFFTLFFIISCNNSSIIEMGLECVNQNIKEQFAPDKRVVIYDIKIDSYDDNILVSGETNSKAAYKKLLDSLKSIDITFISKVRILPDSVVGDFKYAVARNSVINFRSKPKHSAELGTQGLLGMPLKVLDKKGDFYRIQTPDNYISWVDKGGITRMDKGEYDAWNKAEKIIFTENFGYVYANKNKNSNIVSDITLGGMLLYISEDNSFYEAKYPDGRIGYIKKNEASKLKSYWFNLISDHKNITEIRKNKIESIAKNMIGFPYLWGGTSSKGVDCSGFTKMVYLMNGFIIPRDASQQINAGKVVDKNLDFSNLEKGDLLFFGTKTTSEKKRRVVHVGIWLGNGKQEFIHSSGNVHLSSMDKNQLHYDEFNKNRYLGSRRYLGIKDDDMIFDLKEKN